MKLLKNTSLALLSTLIMSTQSSVADVLTDTQLHATLGIVTHFILDDSGISHNGTTYGEVTSPYTGRVWLDRNLGASKVCTALDDTACYGGYYQWGRAHDGHQVSTSNDIPTLANNVTNVGHGDFITNGTAPRDWASVDVNGTTRVSNWTATDGSSVCPIGFRVPTIAEINAELFDVGSAEIANNTDAFNSFLVFPSAGYRNHVDGSMNVLGGYVWTSVVSGSDSYGVGFISSGVSSGYVGHTYGFTVRCIKAQTHNHNGTTYGEVVSPYTGKVWLDRNLGAMQVCTSVNDTACYGDYYQWGRNYDGHEDSGSATTTTQATDVTNVGHGDFIKDSNDWGSVDAGGTTRVSNWSATDGSSVCPVDYRVPTIAELEAETLDHGVINRDTAFTNFLKLPSAGHRTFSNTFINVNNGGYIWSNSPIGGGSIGSQNVYFFIGTVGSVGSKRASGFPVRCLRD